MATQIYRSFGAIWLPSTNANHRDRVPLKAVLNTLVMNLDKIDQRANTLGRRFGKWVQRIDAKNLCRVVFK